MIRRTNRSIEKASKLVNSLCDIAHGTHELRALTARKATSHIRQAITKKDNRALYSWLMSTFSYQGLSDQAVSNYIAKHGNARFSDIESGLLITDPCQKLSGFWTFESCGYQKAQRTCSRQEQLNCCPLPKLLLRNGRLNQTAFSLYFFLRDIAGGEVVSFIDRQIEEIPNNASPRMVHQSLVPAWMGIFGVSEKVVSMALATLLLSAPAEKIEWQTAGCSLIVVDSLVHNFLHRSGLIDLLGEPHPYGRKCYVENGCFDVVGSLSKLVDARRFDAHFPTFFPRFVQLAVWRYCAQSVWNVCNGNQIDDKRRCDNGECYLHDECARKRL